MKSVQQARAAAKSLRKELANLEKPVGDLSLNEAQHLLAKLFGYDNWNTLIATLDSAVPAVLKKMKNGFLPVSVDSVAGQLPGYHYKGLTVSLDYLPDVDSDSLYLDFSATDGDGEASDEDGDNFSIPCVHLSALDLSEEAFRARSAFVKAAAQLVAAYVTRDTGLRSLDGALCQLAEGNFDAGREALERSKASAGRESLPQDEIPVGTVGALRSLDGETIIGSFDSLRACAMIQGASRNEDGTLELEWEGTTDIWWDEQRTVHENGEPLFVTEALGLVPLSQVRLVAEEDSDPDA
jgi:hypothetical protein